MRWKGREQSSHVDDRRRGRVGKVGAGLGLGTIIIVVLALFMGEDPNQILQQVQNTPSGQTTGQAAPSAEDDQLAAFVGVVLKETENVWNDLFMKEFGKDYPEPTLVLFSGSDQSACGYASAATGPFYCPGDQQVYIDLSFYKELQTKFRAPGDFAMAYVIAHEVGHHVQNLLGVTDYVHSQRGKLSKAQYNQLSVRLELQADFLAGVWAYHAHKMNNILEKGDVEEALRAANAIGDDRLMKQSQGYVVPDAFTHGTSEQRVRWFRKGLETGDLKQGDTFNASRL
jgi:predicted metalloprotease